MLVAPACNGAGSADSVETPPVIASVTSVAATATPTREEALGPPEPDGKRAYEHVRMLSVEIGPRPAGSPGEAATRDYLRDEFERYGYQVTVQDFAFDASRYLSARIDVGGEAIPALAFAGSAGGTVTGQLIDAGIGTPEDLQPAGINGAVVLIERGDLTLNEKVANAVAAGAAAVVVYNNENGALRTAIDPVSIPAATLTRERGEALVARLAAGQVEATVTVADPTGTAYNVIAKPSGVETCTTVIGGHHDSVAVTGGADDNASGTAAVLELARTAAAMGLPGANCFVLFGAEESGLLGSRAFVDALTPAEVGSIDAMLNLDVVGITLQLNLIGSPDLVEVTRLEAGRLAIDASPSELPQNVGSDHLSFLEAGIPVVMFNRLDDLIHTPSDSIDRIEPQSLEEAIELALATLVALNS